MELTADQKKTVAGWIAQGLGLAEVQRKLREELSLSMTYMDVRFLVLDLGLEVKDKKTKNPPAPPIPDEPGDGFGDVDVAEANRAAPGGGPLSLELDRVVKPGSVVSGSVTFSDGVKASWALDQFGRLALDAGQAGYAPSREDLSAFQRELRSALESRGF